MYIGGPIGSKVKFDEVNNSASNLSTLLASSPGHSQLFNVARCGRLAAHV